MTIDKAGPWDAAAFDTLEQWDPQCCAAASPARLGVPKESEPRSRQRVAGWSPHTSALVLGLSFSQASARFDARRAIVITEANAIGTTWLRADQLEHADSKHFRQILTDATAAGLAVYQTPTSRN